MESDHDGRINLPQFCTAMSLISQAKQAAAGGGGGGGVQRGSGLQGNSLHSSLPSSAVSQFAMCVCIPDLCVCVHTYETRRKCLSNG